MGCLDFYSQVNIQSGHYELVAMKTGFLNFGFGCVIENGALNLHFWLAPPVD